MAVWGALRELPASSRIDVWMKGIMNALEDIQTAEQKLAVKQKKESLAWEDIDILKV
jgi:hypothetical protein